MLHKRILLAFVISCPLLVNATNFEQETQFLPLVKKLVAAQRNFDSNTLDSMLSDDYVEISPVGEVDHREEVLKFYDKANAGKAGESPQIEVSDLEVQQNGDHIFLIVKETFSIPGKTQQFAMRVSFSLVKEQQGWLFSTAHYTGIRP
ncbi:nuclear transport factor 2 family protein [Thalassotalea fusca]